MYSKLQQQMVGTKIIRLIQLNEDSTHYFKKIANGYIGIRLSCQCYANLSKFKCRFFLFVLSFNFMGLPSILNINILILSEC